MMETDSSQKNNNSSWLNIGFVKAGLAGVVVFMGCSLANLFRTYFMVKPTNFITKGVTFVVVPAVIIYLVVVVSNKILMWYGFEGFSMLSKKAGERLNFTKIIGVIIGALVGFFLFVFSWVFLANVWGVIETSYGEQAKGCIGILFVGGIVVFLLYRFKSLRQERVS